VNLSLVPIEVGGVVKLNNILFQTAKATLKAESYAELDNIYQVFVDNPSMEVEISGLPTVMVPIPIIKSFRLIGPTL
jgi:hypothetical protein